MKGFLHSTLAAVMLLGASSLAASAQGPSHKIMRLDAPTSQALVGDDLPEAITTQPQGEVVTMVRASLQFAEANGHLMCSRVPTHAEVTFADNGDVYFKDFVSVLTSSVGVWIKGHLDNGVITVSFPQVIYGEAREGAGKEFYTGYVFDDLFHAENPAVPTLSQNQTVTFSYEEGVITQIGNAVIGVCFEDEEGKYFSGMGDSECIFKPFTLEPQTLPEGVETESWRFSSDSGTFPVNVGFQDDKVWIQGLWQDQPEAAVWGTVADGSVTFDKDQYLGLYYGTYFIYFEPLYGMNTLKDKLVMTYDAEAQLMKSDLLNGFALNASTDSIFSIANYKDISIENKKYAQGPAMPMRAKGVSASVLPEFLWEMIGVTELKFELSNLSENGDLLNPLSMYYVVYVDGNPLEFDTEHDPRLEAPMTRVPVNYCDNYTFFIDNDVNHDIYLWFKDWTKIGIQTIYVADGVENTSAIVYSDGSVDEGASLGSIAVDGSEEAPVYYDLQGRRVAQPQPGGVYIRLVGSKASKIMAR